MSPLISRLNFNKGFGGKVGKRNRVPTYSISTSTSSVDEGLSVTFTITTSNVRGGTDLYYTLNTISGTINSSDFVNGSTSGTFKITNNSGSVQFEINADFVSEESESFQLQVRTDSTSGPIVATSSTVTINNASYPISASGGTVISGEDSYTYHIFTSPGTFNLNTTNSVEYLLVAGGGGGGSTSPSLSRAGGGGAGGVREMSSFLTAGSYSVTVGTGGPGATTTPGTGVSGNPTIFINEVYGGGGGGARGPAASPGGSGGGGSHTGIGGTGNISTLEGYPGGNGTQGVPSSNGNGGGGGGAGGAGAHARHVSPGDRSSGYGGIGIPMSAWPAPVISPAIPETDRTVWLSALGPLSYFGGGGGGQTAIGGTGGGGGSNGSSVNFTGGGGGGGGGIGAPGIVIIRYIGSTLYSVTSSADTVSEGDSITFTITTTDTPNQTLYYDVSSNSNTVDSSDFSSGSMSGSFNIVNGSGTVTFTISNDKTLEGTQKFYFQVRKNSISGPIVGRYGVNILDTSIPFSGGTVTTSGGDRIHTFTSSGILTATYPIDNATVLIVAGGGAGGQHAGIADGGGGGAGGLIYKTNVSIGASSWTVTVGGGGGNSSFLGNIAIAGGNGGKNQPVFCQEHGAPGGSGGGGSEACLVGSGGIGFNYPGPTQQGYPGAPGPVQFPTKRVGGGGGGAGGGGQLGWGLFYEVPYIHPEGYPTSQGYSVGHGGNGGTGLTYSISGSPVTYAGGGAGQGGGNSPLPSAPAPVQNSWPPGAYGLGGAGGGGPNPSGSAGMVNTGGGGSGASAGGSGIIIIRYPI